MAWEVTIGGQTFTNANLEGNAYADEATGFPAVLRAAAREAAALRGLLAGLGALSETRLPPATGPVSFTLTAPAALAPGAVVRAESAADRRHFMVGTVTANAGTGLELAVTLAGGGEIKADWVIAPVLAVATRASDESSDAETPSGIQHAVTDLGTVASGTVTIAAGDVDYARIVLGGDVSIDFTAPDAGHAAVKTLFLAQDGTGARVPDFKRDGATSRIRWLTPAPVWTGQGADERCRIVAQHEDGWLYLHADEDIRA